LSTCRRDPSTARSQLCEDLIDGAGSSQGV
jgi:hypothetical protein